MRLFVACLLTLAAGCATTTHLSPEFGRSFRGTFAAQPINKGAPRVAAAGLDSQEASAVSATYRNALVPSEARAEAPPLILLSPQSQQQRGLPPPSVPAER